MLLIFTFASEPERDKFEYLYSRYKNLLLHKAYDVLKDYSLAEDAVSEAYIRVYKNLHKVDDPDSNRTIAYLVTIAKNVALTMLSAGKRIPVEQYDEVKADDFDLEENALAALSSERICVVMQALDEESRGVFLLKYAYDYSNQEIASVFATTENNVRVRLHRARKRLAALLTKEGYTV